MTPSLALAAQPSPFLGPPLTAGQLYKPLDFTSTKTIFLFPPMSSSKLKASTTLDDELDADFYVAPSPSQYWAAFNHFGSRLFVNALRRLASNTPISKQVATNAMGVGIRFLVRTPSLSPTHLLTFYSSVISSSSCTTSNRPKTYSLSSVSRTS
jgi:hypothetical protein